VLAAEIILIKFKEADAKLKTCTFINAKGSLTNYPRSLSSLLVFLGDLKWGLGSYKCRVVMGDTSLGNDDCS
jgi:hypothetical protein